MRRRESSCTPQGLALEKVSNMRKGPVQGNAQVQCSRLWEGPPRTLACSDTWRVRSKSLSWRLAGGWLTPSPRRPGEHGVESPLDLPSPSNPLQDPRTTSTLKPTNHYEYSEHSGQDKFNLQRDVKLVHAPRWSELKPSHILKWVKLKQVERFPAEFFGIIHSFGLPSQSTIVALASCASMEPRSPTCKKRSSTGRFA